MRKLFFFLLILNITSCTGNQIKSKKESQKTTDDVISVENNNQLVVEVDLETSVTENMRLIVPNIFLNNGQYMDLYIMQHFNANEKSKTIRFQLPKNVVPDFNMGLSLGSKEVKEVNIKSIKISFNEITFNINSENITTYFKTNKFVDFDKEQKTFKTKKVDGKHNPILFLRKFYIEKIAGIN